MICSCIKLKMKFSHIADCHLGAWKEKEMRKLCFESFKSAIQISIEAIYFILPCLT